MALIPEEPPLEVPNPTHPPEPLLRTARKVKLEMIQGYRTIRSTDQLALIP